MERRSVQNALFFNQQEWENSCKEAVCIQVFKPTVVRTFKKKYQDLANSSTVFSLNMFDGVEVSNALKSVWAHNCDPLQKKFLL